MPAGCWSKPLQPREISAEQASDLEPTLESIFLVTSRQLRGITKELLERSREEVASGQAAEEIAELRMRAQDGKSSARP